MNKSKVVTIPNLITLARIIIIMFAAIALLNRDNINAFLLYTTAAVTDLLDGFLARALNQISNLGKIFDPIADKLMIASAITILLVQNRIPLWYIIVFALCSLFNLIGGLILIKKYKLIPSAILIGKIAAVSVMFTFLLNIINFWHIEYLYYLSSALLVISVIWYAKHSRQQLQTMINN